MSTIKEQALFKKPYERHLRKYVAAGRPTADNYEYEINKLGQKVLVKTGETNLYKKIQESHEETKIENVMARCIAGDTSMLKPDGLYVDTTQAPKNLLEARQAMQKLENVWSTLSNDIKRKYNFSIDEFIGKSGTEEWLKDMGVLPSKEIAETLKASEAKKTEPKQVLKTQVEEAKGEA